MNAPVSVGSARGRPRPYGGWEKKLFILIADCQLPIATCCYLPAAPITALTRDAAMLLVCCRAAINYNLCFTYAHL
jgi:hypothetical protein